MTKKGRNTPEMTTKYRINREAYQAFEGVHKRMFSYEGIPSLLATNLQDHLDEDHEDQIDNIMFDFTTGLENEVEVLSEVAPHLLLARIIARAKVDIPFDFIYQQAYRFDIIHTLDPEDHTSSFKIHMLLFTLEQLGIIQEILS